MADETQQNNAHERIQKLRDEIEHHSYLYYVKDAPEISDAAFDSLLRDLDALEKKYLQFLDPSSPTQRVGGAVATQFTPVQHAVRMYSLDNALDTDELEAWMDRMESHFGNSRSMVRRSRSRTTMGRLSWRPHVAMARRAKM